MSDSAADSYELEATYTADLWRNADGGLMTGTRYLDNLDVTLAINLDEVWEGTAGTIFLYGLYNNDTTFSDDLVGDLQVVSNIDAPEGFRLFEAWYQWQNGPLSIRTGLYDLNSEFDASENRRLVSEQFSRDRRRDRTDGRQRAQHLSNLLSGSPIGVRDRDRFRAICGAGPAFPEILMTQRATRSTWAAVTAPSVVGEFDWRPTPSTRLWAGTWRYSKKVASPFDSDVGLRNDGAYIGAEFLTAIAGRPLQNLRPIRRCRGETERAGRVLWRRRCHHRSLQSRRGRPVRDCDRVRPGGWALPAVASGFGLDSRGCGNDLGGNLPHCCERLAHAAAQFAVRSASFRNQLCRERVGLGTAGGGFIGRPLSVARRAG